MLDRVSNRFSFFTMSSVPLDSEGTARMKVLYGSGASSRIKFSSIIERLFSHFLYASWNGFHLSSCLHVLVHVLLANQLCPLNSYFRNFLPGEL